MPILKAANRPEGPERVMSDEDIESFCGDCVELLQIVDAANANLMRSGTLTLKMMRPSRRWKASES